VAAEAFSRGTPVIASKIGAVEEMVDHGRTGFHFQPGNPHDLAAVMERAAANPEVLTGMRVEARREYEAKFTSERNYDLVMTAYGRAISEYTHGKNRPLARASRSDAIDSTDRGNF
jgi:glycosyltransferase involved in cell wall biosynthesis